MIENSIILLIVATCAVYIGRRFLRQAKGSGPSCGGCSGGCGGIGPAPCSKKRPNP